jgi:prepilin-type N-terminal cleavage/methylation domain-containing protein
MTKKKGFTLIEIILAIGLIGIISVGFLFALSNHFSLLTKTKDITTDYFERQSQVELTIESLKKDIEDGTLSLSSQTIFGESVEYYPMEYEVDDITYYSYISNVRPTSYTPLQMSDVETKMKNNELISSNIYGHTPFKIEGKLVNDPSTRYDLMLNVVDWYVSSENYIIPYPSGADFSLFDDIAYYSYFYPVYPRDYTLVATSSIMNYGTFTREFPNISDYKGRHVVMVATPGAKSGKLGTPMISKPLFISGIPFTEDLKLHLDAAYINEFESIEVNSSNSRLLRWYDLSSIFGNSTPSEWTVDVIGKEKPLIEYLSIGESFGGKYVRFSETSQVSMQNQVNIGERITVYVLVRNNSGTEDKVVIDNDGYAMYLSEDEINEYGNDWIVLKDVFDATSKHFFLGNSDIDIAEIIIYSGELTQEKSDEIDMYLDTKYSTPVLGGAIDSIDDILVELDIGDSYDLPNVVLANMARGIQKYVTVEWSGNYDTELPGTYIIIGKPLVDSTISFELRIEVED